MITVDLTNTDSIRAAFDLFSDKPFVNLYLSRFFAIEDKKRAISAISVASSNLNLDDDSRMSFLSTEIALISTEGHVWEAERVSSSEAKAVDDIFRQFANLDKYAASKILRDKHSEYWEYVYIVYEMKFGMDEFLYILGKDYLGSLITTSEPRSVIKANIVNLMLDGNRKNGDDREFNESLEALFDSPNFLELCYVDMRIFKKTFDVLYKHEDKYEIFTKLISYLAEIEPASREEYELSEAILGYVIEIIRISNEVELNSICNELFKLKNMEFEDGSIEFNKEEYFRNHLDTRKKMLRFARMSVNRIFR